MSHDMWRDGTCETITIESDKNASATAEVEGSIHIIKD
jgi:hypothetical protein